MKWVLCVYYVLCLFFVVNKAIVTKVSPARLVAEAAELCYNPEGALGQCINIHSCEPLLQLLKGPRPLPMDTVDYLRKTQCGFEGKNPLVCCPYSENPTSKPPRTTPPTPSLMEPLPQRGPPDVTDHPGLRHMPEFCGSVSESKITGGNETDLFEYPWMALLGYSSRDTDTIEYKCGGSLINDRYVLTAAHCVSNLGYNKLTEVRLGEHDLRQEEDCAPAVGCAPPPKDFLIEKIIPHPYYVKDDLTNDIALLRLKGKVNFSQAIRPICLPVGNEQRRSLDKEKVTVTGWGATELGTASQILLAVNLPIVPNEKCKSIYHRIVPVSEKQICAGGVNRQDSCGGDSGGPLQFVGQPRNGGLSYIQYGIVSFGPRQCGSIGKPGVYTRVAYYMDWLLSNVKP